MFKILALLLFLILGIVYFIGLAILWVITGLLAIIFGIITHNFLIVIIGIVIFLIIAVANP